MPDRFPSFTREQARQLAEEHDRVDAIVKLWWKRLVLMFVVLVTGIVVATGIALYKVSEASDHADRSQALAIRLNARLIRDANQRAAESRKAAAKSAQTAYAACRRQQESVIISREFFDVLKPALEAHNPHAKVAKLLADIRAQHSFDVPHCVKPPKGS